MKTRRPFAHFAPESFAALALLALALGAPLRVFGQGYVRRGTMERQGKTWVERDECGSPVKDGARLILRADAGSVRVDTGTERQIKCEVVLNAFTKDESQARRLFAGFKLNIRPLQDGGVLVSGTSARSAQKVFSAEYRITTPAQLSLDLETRGGNITVNGSVKGEVRATTAGGGVKIGDTSGTVKVETAGGNVTLANIGSSVEARTAGGRILVGDVKGDASLETSGGGILAGVIGGTVRAETAGGDIALRGAGGAIHAETAGGQIQIGNAGGSVQAQTAGGSVRIEGAGGQVRVETAGGSIDLYQLRGPVQAETRAGSIVAQIDASGNAFGSSTLETSTGDVKVYLLKGLRLTIDAAIRDAAGHRIISDFPLEIQGGRQNLLRTTVRGRGILNGGGELLRIRCVGGNIEILKLNQQILERLKAQQAEYWKGTAQSGP
jgi:hypothetical protein